MFSLLYGFWEYIFRKEELRVLILGLDKAGKTNLLERLKTLYTDSPGLESDKVMIATPSTRLMLKADQLNEAHIARRMLEVLAEGYHALARPFKAFTLQFRASGPHNASLKCDRESLGQLHSEGRLRTQHHLACPFTAALKRANQGAHRQKAVAFFMRGQPVHREVIAASGAVPASTAAFQAADTVKVSRDVTCATAGAANRWPERGAPGHQQGGAAAVGPGRPAGPALHLGQVLC